MPKRIFHYSDISSFVGMLENNELWVSNSNFLNDPSEVSYANTIFKSELNNFSGEDEKYFERLEKWIFGVSECHDKFILSLSVNNNSLNLWERYANGKGCCLHFDFDRLIEQLKGFRMPETPKQYDGYFVILYSYEKQKKIMNELLNKYLKFQKNNPYSSPIDTEDTANTASEIYSFLHHLKHEAYKDEEEVRCVFSLPNRNGCTIEEYWKNNINFRTRENKIIPYIKLGIDFKKILKAISLGPLSTEIDKLGVEDYLYSKGFRNIPVDISNIPYRK